MKLNKQRFNLLSLTILFGLLVGCEPEFVEVEPTLVVPTRADVVETDATQEAVVEISATEPVQVTAEAEAPEPVLIPTAVAVEVSEEDAAESVETTEETAEAIDAQPADVSSTLRMAHSLIWGGAEVTDPYAATRFAEFSLFVHERLLRLDGSGTLVPVLATDWQSNGDGSVWTFTIRSGVTFHNGQPLSPADVVYSFERMLDGTAGSTLQSVLQQISSVAQAGNDQVVIELSSPDVEFPLLLTDERAVILQSNVNGTPSADEVGTGPFKLESIDINGITQLVINDGYWAGRPGVGRVEIIAIPDDVTRIDAMLAEQIDMLDDITAEQKAQFADGNRFGLQNVPTGNWRGFAMRVDSPPFDNPAVRQAIKLAADRQALVDQVLNGAGTVACDHPVWAGDRYHNPLTCEQDIEQAKTLLADAGYANGIDLTIRTSSLDPYWPQLLAVYQQQAAAAGIRLEIIEDPAETFWTTTWLIEPFITTSWNERPAHLILNEAWRSGAPWNETYWNESEFDQLLAQAAAEPDVALRRGFYWQAQELLAQTGGSFIPFHLNQTRVISTCIAGIQPIAAEHIDFAKIVKTPNCN